MKQSEAFARMNGPEPEICFSSFSGTLHLLDLHALRTVVNLRLSTITKTIIHSESGQIDVMTVGAPSAESYDPETWNDKPLTLFNHFNDPNFLLLRGKLQTHPYAIRYRTYTPPLDASDATKHLRKYAMAAFGFFRSKLVSTAASGTLTYIASSTLDLLINGHYQLYGIKAAGPAESSTYAKYISPRKLADTWLAIVQGLRH